MAGMFLYTGNKTEDLSKKAAEVIYSDTTSPFYKEIFLVQTKGMSKWLSMEMAKHGGIFANFDFINLNDLTGRLFFDLAESNKHDKNPFEKDLRWIIMEELRGGLLDREEFLPLKKYVTDEKDSGFAELKLFQLSQKIADSFDQYQISRFDMIEKWNRKELFYADKDKNDIEKWQMMLWNTIEEKHRILNRYDITKDLFNALKKANITPKVQAITERINVFGLSVIPPIYLDLLAALSQHIEINLFLLNPCADFWFDIKSDREKAKIRKKMNRMPGSETEDHIETGNSLLANLGKTGKDFFGLLYDSPFSGEEEFFTENGEGEHLSLLKDIQNDILSLNHPQDKVIATIDDSLKIVSCHSKMREVEILFDNLLQEFETQTDLKPRDIVVMAPDIAEYAPYIDAVFGTVTNEKMKIPYRITDRSLQSESMVADCYLAIINFLSGRFEVSSLLEILQNKSIRKKAGLSNDDINLIAQWLKDTNIRWGIDAKFKQEVGSNGEEWNTWSAGLDRMIAGYCMYSENDEFTEHILPYEEIEGKNGVILGKFMAFFTHLKTYRKQLILQRHLLSSWSDLLVEMLHELFLADNDTEKEISLIEKLLTDLNSNDSDDRKAAADPEIGYEVLKSYLSELMTEDNFESGFISGAVTFCSTKPMRSIPFEMICMLGMNDNAFPRKNVSSAIDLMNLEERPGDRNPKNSDRYLFLETIMSVREKLYISYIGRSIKDNSPKMPSILVSELIDYISEGYTLENYEENIGELITEEHPLQPFSRKYFTKGSGLFSYSQENSAIFTNIKQHEKSHIKHADKNDQKEHQSEVPAEVTITSLIRFFKNPAKYYVTEILKARYPEPEEGCDDTENFALDILDNYSLTKDILEKVNVDEFQEEKKNQILKAKGVLPHGNPGHLSYDNIVMESKSFAKKLHNYISKGKLEKLQIDKKITINGINTLLTGSIDDIYPDALVKFRPTKKEKEKDFIELWINHLLLNIRNEEGYPDRSLFFAKETPAKKGHNIEFNRVDNPEGKLAKLLTVYEEGINGFIPFHPELSKSFYDEFQKSNDNKKAFAKALGKWTNTYQNLLREDIYLKQCLQEIKFESASEELINKMKDLAELVFGEMGGE